MDSRLVGLDVGLTDIALATISQLNSGGTLSVLRQRNPLTIKPSLRTSNPGAFCAGFAFYMEECYIKLTMEVAVIKTGGKQYVVSKGDIIAIEKLPGDLKKGDTVVFGEVLLVDNGSDTTIGAPVIKGAEVKGTVVLAGLGKKVEVVKYKPKSRYYKRKGHRQPLLKVKIDSIS